MRRPAVAEVQPGAPDEAGPFIGFGRVTNQAGGFVDYEQGIILVQNVQRNFFGLCF